MKYSQIGTLIRKEREKHGWEQAELAAMLGVGQQTVSRWEKGGSRPRQEELSRLITMFSVDSAEWWLIAGYQPEEPDQSLAPFLPLGNLSAENFELFCRDLIQSLNPKADVFRYGSSGDTQEGIDICAKGPEAILDYQCKRHKAFGPADIEKAVQATTFQADHHYLLLGRTATPGARKAILAHGDWTLWDRENISTHVRSLPPDAALRIVDTYFPGKRKIFLGREEPSPWLTLIEFFQPLISRLKLFSHGWNFVGRKSDLVKLKAFETNTELQAIIISGRGGIGKSRLLREWGESVEKGVLVLFVAPGADIRPQDYELLPKGPAFLIIDDAHDRLDIIALLSGIARLRPELKLVLSTRSYGLSKLQDDLTQTGVTFDRDGVVKLQDLSLDEAEKLAQEILQEVGGNTEHARRIGEITKDCPLATVIGSHLVAKGQINPELMSNDDKFRVELMRSFRNVLTGQIGYSGPEAERDLLNFLAMVQPFNPANPNFQEAVEKLLNRRFDLITRDLRALEEGGILLRRGNNLRVVPDLLADYIRTEAAYDEKNQMPTGYINTLFALVQDELATNVLANISQIDWKLSVNGVQALLLDQVWANLKHQFREAKIFERTAILSMIEKVAFYQPSQALDFVHIALEQPTSEVEEEQKRYTFTDLSYRNVLEKIPGILRYVAYDPDYVLEVLEILKQLTETDARPANQNPDHPLRVLQEIASIEPGKPITYNELVTHHVIGWLGQPPKGIFSPFDVLDQLLQTEGQQTESKGMSITFRSFRVRPEAVSELRRQVVDAAVVTIRSKPLKEAFRALKSLETGLHFPSGYFGQGVPPEDRAVWEPYIIYVFDQLKTLVDDPALDPFIAAEIRGVVSWHHVYSKSQTRTAAEKVLVAIPDSLPYDISRAILDPWGRTFETANNPGLNQAALVAWRNQLSQRLLDTYGQDFPQLIQMLEERVSTLQQAQSQNGADIGQFLATLLMLSAPLAVALGEYLVTNPQSSLANWFNVVVVVMSKQDRALALELAKTGLAQEGTTLIFSVASALAWGLYDLPVINEEIALIRQIALFSDPWIRRTIVRSVRRFPTEKKTEGLHILLIINISDVLEVADEVLGEFQENYGTFKVADLTEAQVQGVLAQLVTCPSVGGYHVELFLGNVSFAYPKQAVQFLIDRVEHKAAHPQSKDYDPLPLSVHEGFRFRFFETPEYDTILRTVRNWCFVNTSNWVVPFYGPRLFKLVSAGFDGVTLKILQEWIMSADEHQLEAAANLLHEAEPSFVWENQEFVINLLDQAQKYGSTCYKRVCGSLHSFVIQGERFGTVGQPFPQDIDQRDRSLALMSKLPIGSPAHKFYKMLYEIAKNEIARRSAEDFDLE